MVAGNPRQPGKAKVVRSRRSITVIRLQKADDVLVKARPQPGAAGVLLHITLKVLAIGLKLRHGKIAGKNVIQGRNVGRTLNRRVTAKRENAATGPPNIP